MVKETAGGDLWFYIKPRSDSFSLVVYICRRHQTRRGEA